MKEYMNPEQRLDFWRQYQDLVMSACYIVEEVVDMHEDKDEANARHLLHMLDQALDFIQGRLPELREAYEHYEDYRRKQADLLDKLEGRWWSNKQLKYLTYEEYRKELAS